MKNKMVHLLEEHKISITQINQNCYQDIRSKW